MKMMAILGGAFWCFLTPFACVDSETCRIDQPNRVLGGSTIVLLFRLHLYLVLGFSRFVLLDHCYRHLPEAGARGKGTLAVFLALPLVAEPSPLLF